MYYNVALTLVKRPCLMCFGRRLFKIWPLSGKDLFNVFCFWGPRNTGPNPDHPFQNNLQGLPGPSVPWGPYSGRLFNFLFFRWPYCKGRGGGGGVPKTKIKEGPTVVAAILFSIIPK